MKEQIKHNDGRAKFHPVHILYTYIYIYIYIYGI
jgi:hypothetical protein